MGVETQKVPTDVDMYKKANDILGVDLLDVSINGPKEKLESTVQEISMGLDTSNEELSTRDLRIEDVENYLAPLSEAIEQQYNSVDLTALFVTDKIFDSRKELILWAQNVAIGLNTVVVIAKSDAGHNSQKPRVLLEIKRSYKVGIDKNTCRCILRVTHGLPCAHEIADFSRQNRAIPLLSCDSHWSKLSIVPTTENHNELDGSLEIKRLIKRFQECNDEQRRILIKKIRELANPETTWLNEPLAAVVSKGRPRKLTKRQRAATYSTKRDYSGFEYVKTIEDLESIQNKTLKKQPKRKKLALIDLNEDELINHLQSVHKKILKK
ncbi:hypothetical protein LguiA_013817 [Lonicera macranthoides]